MKRLILMFWLMLGVSAFGINITNYPATNAFDGSMTFLLSKASAATNFNIQADLIASTNWSIATFDPSGSATAATNGYPWTNIVVQEAVHATNADNVVSATYVTTSPLTNHVNIANVDTPGAIVTNGNTWIVVGGGTIGASGATNLLTGKIVSTNASGNSGLELNGAVLGANLNVIEYKTNNVSKFSVTAAGAVTAAGSISGGDIISSSQFIGNGGRYSIFGLANNSVRLAGASTAQITNISFGDTGGTFTAIRMYGGSFLAPYLIPTYAFVNNTNGPADFIVGGTLTATNGVNLMVKPSFTTNFTCTTNLQVYLCNGTNQIVTLPNAAYVPNVIYRFASTNGWGKFIITNATGAQTIRDGTSLSFTQIGIGSPAFFSDGAHWWPAARTKMVMPTAQFSCTTNIPLTLATTSYPVTFNTTDFNNSQGIALGLGTNGTHYSKMWITNAGQYEFTPSIVINFGGNNTVTTWFKQDDVNVANSATAIKGAAGGSIRCVTIPFVVSVTNTTAFEIWCQSTSTGDSLSIQAAGGVAPNDMPLSPSIICPIKKISDSWP